MPAAPGKVLSTANLQDVDVGKCAWHLHGLVQLLLQENLLLRGEQTGRRLGLVYEGGGYASLGWDAHVAP